MNNQEISDVKVMLVKGIDGEGVASIEKTGTSGLVDTYTITYTDGKKTTFTVTNGKGIVSIAKTATTGTVDTYTITYNDNTTSTFEVTNGTVASAIAYDNTESGLTGDTVQEVVDELAESYPADKVMLSDGVTSVEDALDKALSKLDYAHAETISSMPYTATKDGVAFFVGNGTGVGYRYFYVNSILLGSIYRETDANYYSSCMIPLSVGDQVTSNAAKMGTYTFVPYATT